MTRRPSLAAGRLQGGHGRRERPAAQGLRAAPRRRASAGAAQKRTEYKLRWTTTEAGVPDRLATEWLRRRQIVNPERTLGDRDAGLSAAPTPTRSRRPTRATRRMGRRPAARARPTPTRPTAPRPGPWCGTRARRAPRSRCAARSRRSMRSRRTCSRRWRSGARGACTSSSASRHERAPSPTPTSSSSPATSTTSTASGWTR